MERDLVSRRAFLLQSSATALAPLLTGAGVNALRAIAVQAAGASPSAGFLSAKQLAIVTAAADRIFPGVDGQPNASALHVPQFIDIALDTVAQDDRAPFVSGLEALEAATTKLYPRSGGFTSLDEGRQDAVLRGMEKTPVLQMLRGYTIAGCFSDPKYGGNYRSRGFELIGLEHRGAWAPPFGYYDRETQDVATRRATPAADAPSFMQAGGAPAARYAPEADIDFVIVGSGIAGGSVAAASVRWARSWPPRPRCRRKRHSGAPRMLVPWGRVSAGGWMCSATRRRFRWRRTASRSIRSSRTPGVCRRSARRTGIIPTT
jgi:hypothetical protein